MGVIALTLTLLGAAQSLAGDVDALLRAALAAEAKLDSQGALTLFLAADRERPNDAFILQKIAQQYSDLIVDLPDRAERKRSAETALSYAQRAVVLAPDNAVNVLSLAVCHGKLATESDTRAKLEYSRLVKEEAERAITLDPAYAWAHHVLGRWHGEVAALSGTARWFVRVVYGELPPASTARAVEELRRAVALEPGELAHQLELGFAYLADKQFENARVQFVRGLALPSLHKHDPAAKERARQALEKLQRRTG